MSVSLQLIIPASNSKKKKKKKHRSQEVPVFMAEPMRASNSFVGTEEYIAPVCYYSTSFILLSTKNYGSIYVSFKYIILC